MKTKAYNLVLQTSPRPLQLGQHPLRLPKARPLDQLLQPGAHRGDVLPDRHKQADDEERPGAEVGANQAPAALQIAKGLQRGPHLPRRRERGRWRRRRVVEGEEVQEERGSEDVKEERLPAKVARLGLSLRRRKRRRRRRLGLPRGGHWGLGVESAVCDEGCALPVLDLFSELTDALRRVFVPASVLLPLALGLGLVRVIVMDTIVAILIIHAAHPPSAGLSRGSQIDHRSNESVELEREAEDGTLDAMADAGEPRVVRGGAPVLALGQELVIDVKVRVQGPPDGEVEGLVEDALDGDAVPVRCGARLGAQSSPADEVDGAGDVLSRVELWVQAPELGLHGFSLQL